MKRTIKDKLESGELTKIVLADGTVITDTELKTTLENNSYDLHSLTGKFDQNLEIGILNQEDNSNTVLSPSADGGFFLRAIQYPKSTITNSNSNDIAVTSSDSMVNAITLAYDIPANTSTANTVLYIDNTATTNTPLQVKVIDGAYTEYHYDLTIPANATNYKIVAPFKLRYDQLTNQNIYSFVNTTVSGVLTVKGSYKPSKLSVIVENIDAVNEHGILDKFTTGSSLPDILTRADILATLGDDPSTDKLFYIEDANHKTFLIVYDGTAYYYQLLTLAN